MVRNLIVFCVVHSWINRSKTSLVFLRLAMVPRHCLSCHQILTILLQDKQTFEEVTKCRKIPSLLPIQTSYVKLIISILSWCFSRKKKDKIQEMFVKTYSSKYNKCFYLSDEILLCTCMVGRKLPSTEHCQIYWYHVISFCIFIKILQGL